jgi:hypothetical protein
MHREAFFTQFFSSALDISEKMCYNKRMQGLPAALLTKTSRPGGRTEREQHEELYPNSVFDCHYLQCGHFRAVCS